jgi:alpha-1,2-mannosyltransferase
VLARRGSTAVAWVALAVSAALCLHYVVMAREAYLLDLDVYREASEIAWAAGDLYGLTFTDVGLPYLYPPFAILFLTPIAALSEVSAQVVWTLITLAAVIVYAVLCVRNFAAEQYQTLTVFAVTIAFTLAMEPTESGLNFGQVNILLAMFMVLDMNRHTGRIPQGVLTGIAAAVKLTPLLVAVYYLTTRRVKPALVTIGTFLACNALAAVIFPQASWVYWTGTFAASDRVGVGYISNQSINGLLQRLLGDTGSARLAWLLLAGVVALATLLVAHHLFGSYPHLTDALVLASILLISPISWTAHWILILPLLLVAALPDRPVPALQILAAMLAAALLYGVVRPEETAHILADPGRGNVLFGNTFTWLTLLVAVACVGWYWSRTTADDDPPQRARASL